MEICLVVMKRMKSKKAQSLIAGLIFVVVFGSLFFILMRYGDLYRTEGHAIKDVTGMDTRDWKKDPKPGDVVNALDATYAVTKIEGGFVYYEYTDESDLSGEPKIIPVKLDQWTNAMNAYDGYLIGSKDGAHTTSNPSTSVSTSAGSTTYTNKDGQLIGADGSVIGDFVPLGGEKTPSSSNPKIEADGTKEHVKNRVVQTTTDAGLAYTVTEKDGEVTITETKVTISGNTITTFGASTPTVSDASAYNNVDWGKWKKTEDKTTYPLLGGGTRSIEINTYTDTSSNGLIKTTYTKDSSSGDYIKSTEIETVQYSVGSGLSATTATKGVITYYSGANQGKVQVGSTYWDKDVFDESNVNLQLTFQKDATGRTLWLSDSEKVDQTVSADKSTVTYSFKSSAGDKKPFLTDKKIEIQIVSGSDRTVKTIKTLEGSNVVGTEIVTTFTEGGVQTTIREEYEGRSTGDDDLKEVTIETIKNKGTPDEEVSKITLENDVYANYLGSRESKDLDNKAVGDIAFAYDKLGDDGKFSSGKYTTQTSPSDDDYEQVTITANQRAYQEKRNNKVVEEIIEYTGPTSGYEIGDVVTTTREYDGNTVRSYEITVQDKDGNFKSVEVKDKYGNVFTTEFEYEDGERSSTTKYNGKTYSFDTNEGLYQSDKSFGTVGGYRIEYFDEDGNPYVNKDGDWVKAEDLDGLSAADKKAIEDAKKEASKAIDKDEEANQRQDSAEKGFRGSGKADWSFSWYKFEQSLTMFQGLSGFSSIFWEEEDLQEWRETVDQQFASLYLGIDYWTSAICAEDVDKLGEGLLYVNSPSGMVEVGAHVEGERTELPFGNGTAGKDYLYKLSFYIANPNGVNRRPEHQSPEFSFNVYIYGDKTVMLYNESITLSEGDSWSRIGDKMVVSYSKTFYNKICIQFSREILTADNKKVMRVCNVITPYQGGAEGYSVPGAGGTGSGSSGSWEVTENPI